MATTDTATAPKTREYGVDNGDGTVSVWSTDDQGHFTKLRTESKTTNQTSPTPAKPAAPAAKPGDGVFRNSNGTYRVVVNGVTDPSPWPSAEVANNYYANVTRPMDQTGNTTPVGGDYPAVPDANGTYQTAHSGRKALADMLAGLDQAGGGTWNGDRANVQAVLAAYDNAGNASPTGPAATGPSAITAVPGTELYNNQVWQQVSAAATAAYQQGMLKNANDRLALDAAAQAADEALKALTLAGSLTGPRNAFTQQAVMHGLNVSGVSNYFASLSTGGPQTSATSGTYYTPQPISIASLIGDTSNAGGFTAPSPTVTPTASGAGTATPTAATPITADQVNSVAQGLQIAPSFVQAYVTANGKLPSDPASFNDFLNSAGLRNPTTGALGTPPSVAITGSTGAAAAPAAQANAVPAVAPVVTPVAAVPAVQPVAQPAAQPAAVPAVAPMVAPGGNANVQQQGFTVQPQANAGEVLITAPWTPPSATAPAVTPQSFVAPTSPMAPTPAPNTTAASGVFDTATGKTDYGKLYDYLTGQWNQPQYAGKTPTQQQWAGMATGAGLPSATANALAGQAYNFATLAGRAPTRDEFANLTKNYDPALGTIDFQNLYNTLAKEWSGNPANAGKSPTQQQWSLLAQQHGLPKLQADQLAGSTWSWMNGNGGAVPTADQFSGIGQGMNNAWVNSLPKPSQINPVNFMRGSPDDQATALAGYAKLGFSPTDVQASVKSLLPSFTAPSFGQVA